MKVEIRVMQLQAMNARAPTKHMQLGKSRRLSPGFKRGMAPSYTLISEF